MSSTRDNAGRPIRRIVVCEGCIALNRLLEEAREELRHLRADLASTRLEHLYQKRHKTTRRSKRR